MPQDYAPAAISDGYKYLTSVLPVDMKIKLGGIKGDAAHYAEGGYHVPSRACSFGDYSTVQPYDKGAGVDKYAASALDITPGKAETLHLFTQRLIDAVNRKDPRLYPLREFFGTTNGVKVVGRDVPSGRSVSSDDSHLWHLHLSWKRKHANDAAAIRGVMDIIAGKSADKELTLNADDKKYLDAQQAQTLRALANVSHQLDVVAGIAAAAKTAAISAQRTAAQAAQVAQAASAK